MTTKLLISGMTCNHCKQSVGRALQGVPGVSAVVVDVPGGTADVTHAENTPLASLVTAVQTAGYEARHAS